MIKIELKIPFDQIAEIKRKGNKVLIVKFKNDDRITLYGSQAISVYKKLCRNKAGEHMD